MSLDTMDQPKSYSVGGQQQERAKPRYVMSCCVCVCVCLDIPSVRLDVFVK